MSFHGLTGSVKAVVLADLAIYNTSAAVTNVSKLLNEGVGQTTDITAAHSSTIPSWIFSYSLQYFY